MWHKFLFHFGFPFKGSFLYMYSRKYILISLNKNIYYVQFNLVYRTSTVYLKIQWVSILRPNHYKHIFFSCQDSWMSRNKSSHQVWDVYKYGGYDLFLISLTKLEHLLEKFQNNINLFLILFISREITYNKIKKVSFNKV